MSGVGATREGADINLFWPEFMLSCVIDWVALVERCIAAGAPDIVPQQKKTTPPEACAAQRKAKTDALRKTIQREHPDKGGNRTKFERAMNELDALRQ